MLFQAHRLMAHCIATMLSSASGMAIAAPGLLTSERPIVVPGGPAHFDFMQADATNGLLLAAHKGAKSLLLLDLRSGKVLPEINVGVAQGVAVDAAEGRYFVGDEDEKKIVVVDAKSRKVTGEIPVPGAVDAIAYDSKRGLVYADEDGGLNVWVVDVIAKKVVATVVIPGVAEYVEYDPVTDRIYQNIKTKDLLVVIHPSTHKVEKSWSTLPATSPHGLAIDQEHGRIFVAGGNGKLISIEIQSGKVTSSVDIVRGVDQIAFDPKKQVVYCAGKGSISAVKVTPQGLTSLGNTPAPNGAKTLAIDPLTHDIWVSYTDKTDSYVQRFKVQP